MEAGRACGFRRGLDFGFGGVNAGGSGSFMAPSQQLGVHPGAQLCGQGDGHFNILSGDCAAWLEDKTGTIPPVGQQDEGQLGSHETAQIP